MLLALVVMALALSLVLLRFSPPPPRPVDAPGNVFAAARAHSELEALLGDGSPHPVGSDANRRVRDRIVERLEALGYQPQVQRRFVCGHHGACTDLDNVIAVIQGGDDAVMLSVHYDSVGAGPGASDDGVSVAAALEIARVLKAAQARRNTVVLAFLDGEEAGLLGAKAFVAHHPLARRIRAVINLDARGSSGPSLMFETAGSTAALSEIMADNVQRPLTSSLFAAVYDMLPNDTDFSVFRQHGMAGYNFAFIQGVAHYHTSLDDLAHVSHASLQHHGDNALSLLQALADSKLGQLTRRGREARAVWFDFLGLHLVHWREKQSLPLSLLAVLLLALGAALRIRHQPRGTFGTWARGMGATLLAMLLAWLVASAAGFALTALLASGTDRFMPAGAGHSVALGGLWCLAAASTLSAGALLARRVGPWARYLAVWSLWSVLGCVVAALFPPACHLFVAPALVAGVAGLAAHRAQPASMGAALLRLSPAFVAACLWLRVGLGLFYGIGLLAHPAITLTASLALAGVLPLAVVGSRNGLSAWRWRVVLPFVLAATASALMLARTPAYDANSPQRMSIAHFQRSEDEDSAAWWVDASWGPVPEAVKRAARLSSTGNAPLPWIGFGRIASGPAPRIDAPTPLVDVVQDGPADQHSSWRRLVLRARSQRGSRMIALLLPPSVSLQHASIRGVSLPPRVLRGSPSYNGYTLIASLSTPAAGEEFELTLATSSPLAIEVIDVQHGLPSIGEALQRARAPVGVPSQEGDLSIVATTVELNGSDSSSER
jgi:hypothetical protein